MSNKKTIVICQYHQHRCPTPLMSTMAFIGAEYWCPFCGEKSDIFSGDRVESTPELEQRLIKYLEESSEYLHAMGARHCSSLMFGGKRISPDELPQEEKDRLRKIIDNGWKYGVFIE